MGDFEQVRVALPDGAKVYPDGIYFGLDNEPYHADPALGSSGLRNLLRGGPTYWWHSHMNPQRPRKVTRALTFGDAVHTIVLEGREKFEAKYAAPPDPDGLLCTYADLRTWLKDHGEVKIGRSKAEAVAQALKVDPSVRIEDVEVARITDSGRTMLSDDDWARTQVAGAMIRNNPELRTSFAGGIAEVSVFWTDESGIRMKARFDYLKPRGIGDLKTLGDIKDQPFDVACRTSIARRKGNVQAAHYLDGRARFPAFYAAGQVWGDHDVELAKRIAAAPQWGWAWVFIQSIDAPLTWSTALQVQNPIVEVGRLRVGKAVATYREFMDRFGPGNMWVISEPVTELDQTELPAWWDRDW
jgi:hypothetical protein